MPSALPLPPLLNLIRLNRPAQSLLERLVQVLQPARTVSDSALCHLPALVHSDQEALAYLYVSPDFAGADQLRELLPAGLSWTELTPTVALTGASAGAPASHHYVVETDVLPDWEAEMNQWYDTEHLPGLAAVPGTIRAARSLTADGPRYFASYELASLETFGSPPWLAVRATDWSSRVRPSFRGTRRTMFRHLLGEARR